MSAAEPIVVRAPAEIRAQTDRWRAQGETVGFVPTMGALHRGHLSLVEQARAENTHTVVSIFVNPLQFGPSEDFDRYPRTPERDLALLGEHGVDAVYMPSGEVMYPPGAQARVRVGTLGEILEGASRPEFFEGVATVVTKLFNVVRPDRAYFGQKDAQQCLAVQRLVLDLDIPVEVRVCPTVREPDGLALSSRNAYLNPDERLAARSLVNALRAANVAYRAGERQAAPLEQALCKVLSAEPLAQVDYARVVDPTTFTAPRPGSNSELRAVLAVRIGTTRLIDNHLLGSPLPEVR